MHSVPICIFVVICSAFRIKKVFLPVTDKILLVVESSDWAEPSEAGAVVAMGTPVVYLHVIVVIVIAIVTGEAPCIKAKQCIC